LVEGALKAGAGDPIKGMRWLLPDWAMEAENESSRMPEAMLNSLITRK
jgi:hypothetical protein